MYLKKDITVQCDPVDPLVSSICNLLLENPDYPRRETAAVAAAAPSSILLESGNTQTDVSQSVCQSSGVSSCTSTGHLFTMA